MHLTLHVRALRLNKMANYLNTKRPRISRNFDHSYFDSYADITVHEEMLGDEVRTSTYKKAIFSLKNMLFDKVVLDVGAGTGILSCFCAQAGAKKVYAVEASNIAEQAKKVIISNGLDAQIEVIQGLLEDVTLPEKVDVIVSEWMGYCLLYESMLSSVITARDRWLKADGILLPSSASLYVVPVCDDAVIVENVNFWNDMEEVYGVDMSCMLPFARKSLSKEVMVKTISCENVLSKPQLISHFDLRKVTQEQIEEVKHDFNFSSFGLADLQGFAVWFDVGFLSKLATEEKITTSKSSGSQTVPNTPTPSLTENSESHNSKGNDAEIEDNLIGQEKITGNGDKAVKNAPIVLSTSPYRDETHWKQSILYLDDEVKVKQDSQITGSIVLTPCPSNRRFLSIQLACQVDGGEGIEKNYLMGYELPNNEKKCS